MKHIHPISCRPKVAQELPGSAKWALIGGILDAIEDLFDPVCLKGVCSTPKTSDDRNVTE